MIWIDPVYLERVTGDEGASGAMPQAARATGLRPQPATRSSQSSVTIAGALRDWRGLCVVGLLVALAVFV